MKNLFTFVLVVLSANFFAQANASFNIDLISVISPDTSFPYVDNNKYSGCWGWYQASKNKEYAISGARNGTYFVDVTNPATPSVCAYVKGVSQNCTWREVKTYQNYCYIVSDACSPNAFQIVDMQYLPDSVVLVHSDTTKFILGHTAWVDQDKLYVGITNFGQFNGGYSPMTVWSLADPEDPQLLRRLEQDDQVVNEVHDMYVRNDTVYASAGWHGLQVYKFNDDTTFSHLGSYTGYENMSTYNHSSFLTANGKYVVFCDEVPQSLPVKLVNVENLQNIQPVRDWHPEQFTTPHNPYVIGNSWVVVSSYQDGLFIYDISKPPIVGLSGYFDTYAQGGHNTGDYGGSAYAGNWGAYPFLPSGIIIATDMSNGLYLLDAEDAYKKVHYVGVQEYGADTEISVYPNPASDKLYIESQQEGEFEAVICNLLGEVVYRGEASTEVSIDTGSLPSGTYALVLKHAGGLSTRKVIITH